MWCGAVVKTPVCARARRNEVGEALLLAKDFIILTLVNVW